jgi:aryl-alcohol dehydrogenase-like predicted oxidoreductase
MYKRKFGKNGPEVTIIGLGAGHIGETGQDERSIERFLNEVLDLGINFIDTARAYGLSEQRIGKYISHRRSEFFLSTKVGYDVQWKPDWSYDSVVGGVDQALKLMRTDYLDIVHLHSCSKEILEQGDVINGLEAVKKAGKARFIAYSGENEALDHALGTGRFDSIQTSVNICDQRGISNYLPKAAEAGLGVIAKRPIANAPWRHSEPPVGHYSEEYWHRLKKMNLEITGIEMAELAIRFSAFTAGVTTCIFGTSKIDHLKGSLASVEKGALPGEMTDYLNRKFRGNDDNWVGLI